MTYLTLVFLMINLATDETMDFKISCHSRDSITDADEFSWINDNDLGIRVPKWNAQVLMKAKSQMISMAHIQ